MSFERKQRIAELETEIKALQKERDALIEEENFLKLKETLKSFIVSLGYEWGKLEKEQYNKIINTCLQGMTTSIHVHEDLAPGKGPYESVWFEKTISYNWKENSTYGNIELFYKDNYECEPYYHINVSDSLMTNNDYSNLNKNYEALVQFVHKEGKWDRFFELPPALWAAVLQLKNL